MRLALLFALTLTLVAVPALATCTTSNLQQAVIDAQTRKAGTSYAPRGAFADCYFQHFGPDDKTNYEATQSNAIREAFLYQYILAAFEAAGSVGAAPARKAEYYAHAILAASTYLELTGSDLAVFTPERTREVLVRLGEAYYNRRDLDGSAMKDLVYQYESIAGDPRCGSKCFDTRAVSQWERALRCLSGSCNAADAHLEEKIRAERESSTEFVEHCTSFAQFLTLACAEFRMTMLKPKQRQYNKYLEAATT
jgi:hypothetical protein